MNSGVNDRRRRGCFRPMVSMMNILPPGAEPLMVNVRQTGGSPKLTRAAGQDNSDPAVAEEFLAAGAAGDGAGAPPRCQQRQRR